MCMYTYVKQLRNLTSQFFIHSFFCSSVMSISGVFFIERICVNNFSLANIMQQTLFQQHAHTLEICKCRLKIAFAIKEILHLFFTLELLTFISFMYIHIFQICSCSQLWPTLQESNNALHFIVND